MLLFQTEERIVLCSLFMSFVCFMFVLFMSFVCFMLVLFTSFVCWLLIIINIFPSGIIFVLKVFLAFESKFANKAFQHVETLFDQGRNLVPSRLVIG